jgi:serine/threonine protein phosphatase PrpC
MTGDVSEYFLPVWAATDIGNARRDNEDCVGAGDTVLCGSTGRFALELPLKETVAAIVVADGVGGGRGGRVAAELAVRTFLNRCANVVDIRSLTAVIDGVSESVRLACAQDPATRGGATTLAGLIFSRAGALAFNVGDSRVYQISEKGMTLLSQDHVSIADGRTLTRFLGGSGPFATPFCSEIAFWPGHRYLVCSDGLSGSVEDSLLAQLALNPNGDSAVDGMMVAALEAGAPDNVTVALCGNILRDDLSDGSDR